MKKVPLNNDCTGRLFLWCECFDVVACLTLSRSPCGKCHTQTVSDASWYTCALSARLLLNYDVIKIFQKVHQHCYIIIITQKLSIFLNRFLYLQQKPWVHILQQNGFIESSTSSSSDFSSDSRRLKKKSVQCFTRIYSTGSSNCPLQFRWKNTGK